MYMSVEMEGPYNLDTRTIEDKVTRAAPGYYVLGSNDERGIFTIKYVGRSDSNMRSLLKSLVCKTKRQLFKFSYAPTPRAAFEKECETYHDLCPPDNAHHPNPPPGTDWTCPRCQKSG